MNRPTIILFTIALAVATGAFLSRSSWQSLKTQRAEYTNQIKESRKIDAERTELLKKTADIQSPFGKEKRARELGYRKPYEKPLTIE
ncbi:MAG: septum formation initiator family protein [Fimbriimonadaceae bacterium]